MRDGKVVFEEQGGNIPVVESGVPDLNPLGCQKGASWSQQLYSPDRILHPCAGSASGDRASGRRSLGTRR
ncbi:MAG: hypothetical protein M5U19_08860 [Microthrixaceae bacterium]|nr:hypothetical protein [Microthrixaceae bacterium]